VFFLSQGGDVVQLILMALVGVAAGVFAGLFGVGGGVIIVPALVFFFAVDQHTAQGTSLLVLPMGALLAFWRYYKAGHVDLKLGAITVIGVLVGGYLGGGLAQMIPSASLRKYFAAFIMFAAVKLWFQK
jgi:uncharacterized membrane protein YfcA